MPEPRVLRATRALRPTLIYPYLWIDLIEIQTLNMQFSGYIFRWLAVSTGSPSDLKLYDASKVFATNVTVRNFKRTQSQLFYIGIELGTKLLHQRGIYTKRPPHLDCKGKCYHQHLPVATHRDANNYDNFLKAGQQVS